ncbi:MAG: 30S ribosomal protein S17 [Gammaproteobacteria bacterium]|nr:30S ribosomal protein S17 [Gammaproteobacteria bacterium]
MTEQLKSAKRIIIGKVVSNKSEKSITVVVVRQVRHPKYGKIVSKTKKYHAHDENNSCKIGDVVRIIESRPISKTKTWALHEIVETVQ